jgi:hypothetical protein
LLEVTAVPVVDEYEEPSGCPESANALGVIARAVAIASKANANFFMFPPADRPRGHLSLSHPLRIAAKGQGLGFQCFAR